MTEDGRITRACTIPREREFGMIRPGKIIEKISVSSIVCMAEICCAEAVAES
jgi:hypothetical protein